MKDSKTARGFALVEFTDINGDSCSLQESSVATQNCIWLGCDHETLHPVTQEPCGARMHLDRKLVKQLVTHLNRWLEKGTFE